MLLDPFMVKCFLCPQPRKPLSAGRNYRFKYRFLIRIIPSTMRFPRSVCCALCAILFLIYENVSLAAPGAQRMLYTSPNTTFIATPSGDHAVTVNDASGSIATLQSAISSARASNPTNIIVITLLSNATYVVSSASLVLDSGEC